MIFKQYSIEEKCFKIKNQLIFREVSSITGFRGGERSELACSAYRHSEFYHQKKILRSMISVIALVVYML